MNAVKVTKSIRWPRRLTAVWMCRLLPPDVATEHRETLSQAIKKVLCSQLINLQSSTSFLAEGHLTRKCCSQAIASKTKQPEAKALLATSALCGAVALDAPRMFEEVRLGMAQTIISLPSTMSALCSQTTYNHIAFPLACSHPPEGDAEALHIDIFSPVLTTSTSLLYP